MSEETKPAPTEFPARETPFNLAGFDCPRCGSTMSAEHYGPCQPCVVALRATQVREGGGSGVEAATYEPKMNVTPNAVALKDD